MRRIAFAVLGSTAATGAGFALTRLSSDEFAANQLVDGAVSLGDSAFDYDLIVIGGGSGGLAAAKAAASAGARVALCDFVTPTVHKTTWGLGGTCVNVGCIPKKLMHHSALLSESINHDAKDFGHADATTAAPLASVVNWETLQRNVEMHIRSLNFGYSAQLRSKQVKYLNALATFVEPHTIECKNKAGEVQRLTARRFVLAPGGRPSLMGIPGEELSITSDDLFRLKKDPKKTLVIGGGYIALECAGFLHGIGRSASVVMRSVPLRSMDRDMATRLAAYMSKIGIPIHERTLPTRIEKLEDGRLRVDFKSVADESSSSDIFDTVLMAVGRHAQVEHLGLERAGVALHKGKIEVDRFNRTTAPHIYALGDAIHGGLELTPVAIKAGAALSNRLFRQGTELSDMSGVPTTVFTPLEYGFVGLSEEEALRQLGDDIEVFHQELQPLEWTVPHRGANDCYMKVIVQKSTDRVIGFHVLAPHAGEITQGVAIALKAGATKAHFDACVGIHPTVAESMTVLRITKSSGVPPSSEGGC